MIEIEALYFQRIKESFPRLEIRSIRNSSDGAANDVFVVNEQLVFRFPKNDSSADESLANEVKVIELLRKRVEMPLPEFEFVADDLTVHKFIVGKPFSLHDFFNLNEIERERIVEQLAIFLKQMHGVPLVEIKQSGIALSGSDCDRAGWLELYEDVRKGLFEKMSPQKREMAREHFAPLLRDENFMNFEPCLINGDLKPDHILFDIEKKKVAGVIDFGNAGISDRAFDFACLIYHYGESFLKGMQRIYPEIEASLDRAKFCAGTLDWQADLSAARAIE